MQRMVTNSSTDLDTLPAMWALLRTLRERVEAANEHFRRDTTLLSARRFDEAGTSGLRTYMVLHGLVSAAEDNQLALEKFLQQVGVSTHAPWNLIRPAFEAAFHSLWIMDPESGHERRRRGLQIELSDHRERNNWVNAMQQAGLTTPDIDQRLATRYAEVLAVYESEASHFRSTVKKMNKLPNIVDELPTLRTLASIDRPARYWLVAMWRQLSGLQHAHTYALMAGSDKSEVVKIPGGVEVLVSANDEVFVAAGKASAMLQAFALRRLIDLTERPVQGR